MYGIRKDEALNTRSVGTINNSSLDSAVSHVGCFFYGVRNV